MSTPLGPEGLPAGVDPQSIFRSIFGAYPDALLLVDAQGRIVLANPAADTLFGYASGQLVGLNVDVLVPDSIRPRHAEYRHAYAHKPRARPMGTQMDLVAKRLDGSEVMVEIALSPLHDSAVPLVVVAVRGIGAYPRVKQALQRARYSEYVAQMGRVAVDARDPQVLLQQVCAVAVEALQVEMSVLFLLEPNQLEFLVAAGAGLLTEEGVGTRMLNTADTPAGLPWLPRSTPSFPTTVSSSALPCHRTTWPRALSAR
jgi:PAS domain S-box-containing protein